MNLLSKFVRYGTIAAALFGVVMIVLVSRSQAERQMPPPGDPPVMPPQKPFPHAVAATGILEALSENVAIGVPLPGLVTEVFVKVNDAVKKGQPLLKLDDRDLRAEQLSIQAQQEISRAQITVSQAQLAKLDSQLARLEAVTDSRAVSRDDLHPARITAAAPHRDVAFGRERHDAGAADQAAERRQFAVAGVHRQLGAIGAGARIAGPGGLAAAGAPGNR